MILRSLLIVIFATALVGSWVGCAAPQTSHPILVDPRETQRDSGGTDDIFEAVDRAISDLSRTPKVSEQRNNRVVLDRIVNNTGIPDYDENIIYNQFLSELIAATDTLQFLNREAVAAERELQQAGAVTTEGLGKLSGAAMALTIELRHLPGVDTNTIQYTFNLTNLDGEIVFFRAYPIRKRR